MKREFGFTQERFVQLVISVCHANAKHPKSRPTEAPRSHSYPTLLSCWVWRSRWTRHVALR